MERRRPDAAADYLKPALQLCDRHGLTLTRGFVLSNLSGMAMMSGDHAAAEAYAHRALEHAQGTGNRYVVCFLNLLFVRFALQRRELDAARRHLRIAVELAIALRRPALLVEGASRFAELLAIEGEIAAAHAVAAFIGQHPSADAPEREQLQAALAPWPAPAALPPWPGLTLDELLHRIAVETDSAQRPLIAQLRG
jgi:ATP/maltotriose-dependent transcriptional regulator MalT